MASLVLTAAVSAFSAVGPALATTAATSIASFAASTATSLVFGPTRRRREGPRLESFQVQASNEGAPVLRVFGRARVSGQVIWAANFRETITEETQSGKGARLAPQTTTVNYLYSISIAIGLCEGEIARIGRVWADGKPFDLSPHNFRLYQGSEDQQPDNLIEAVEGNGNAPAFRGLAYIVLEDLPLAQFGNRIPQFSFEVEKPLRNEDGDSLENLMTGLSIIPSSGEFVYGTTAVTRSLGEGIHANENTHNNNGGTDFIASMDALTASLPRVRHGSLIVTWFGDDIRLGECDLRPGIENREKQTRPYDWSVGPQTRQDAYLISQTDGDPSFGGTPADRCVIEAIHDMDKRGIKVMFHPFILMDIPNDTQLTNNDGTNGQQAAFPWRGRISAGVNDGTALAREDISRFFGAARADDFSIIEGRVVYEGPTENSFRRMILHYAYLCRIANQQRPNSVEAFLLGSELRSIMATRDENGAYPAVAQMQLLAQEVKQLLGPDVALSYGADWSEYFGHQPNDGSASRLFHLDPLWADGAIDFIGIDYYMPLSDWRRGTNHLDRAENPLNSPYGIDYLQSNIKGGEGFDWFYASEQDREAQIRTPITDGQHGEDWVFRYKDLWNWWANPHFNRPDGVRESEATPWVPMSKPFRFTELGCPAIDNGANQPNVFVDPQSAESAIPHFSSGVRDDLAQRRLLEAHFLYWQDSHNNPQSSLYNGTMVDADRIYVYAWDARPFPDFPARNTIWGDTQNWTLGHWLNGRIGRAPLDLLVEQLAGEADFTRVDTTGLDGIITGYVVDRPLSPREMIDPLADIFQFDIVESNGRLRFQHRFGVALSGNQVLTLEVNDLRASEDDDNGASPYSVMMGQAHDLPSAFRLGFLDEGADLTPAIAAARDPGLRSVREVAREIPAVLPMEEAEARARSILADAWVMRERISFSMPPSMLALEAGDQINFRDGEITHLYRITEIQDTASRQVEAVRLSPAVYDTPSGSVVFRNPAPEPIAIGPMDWELADLPLLGGDDVLGAPWFGAFSSPWPGGASLVRRQDFNGQGLIPQTGSTDNEGPLGTFVGNDIQAGISTQPAMMGRLVDGIPAFGSVSRESDALNPDMDGLDTHSTHYTDQYSSGRWLSQSILVRVSQGILSSRSMLEVLNGANAIAVQSQNGGYEVLQYQQAELVESNTWRLSTLLRGQAGTEQEANAGAAMGARVMILSSPSGSAFASGGLGVGGNGISQVGVPLDILNIEFDWRAGPQNRLSSDPLFEDRKITLRGRNLMPLSPVHLGSKPVMGGPDQEAGLLIRWVRRTRIGGDQWESEDVPLGEAFERYRLEIWAGDMLLRTVEVSAPQYLYTLDQKNMDIVQAGLENTDFAHALFVRVAQLSDAVGVGVWSSCLYLNEELIAKA